MPGGWRAGGPGGQGCRGKGTGPGGHRFPLTVAGVSAPSARYTGLPLTPAPGGQGFAGAETALMLRTRTLWRGGGVSRRMRPHPSPPSALLRPALSHRCSGPRRPGGRGGWSRPRWARGPTCSRGQSGSGSRGRGGLSVLAAERGGRSGYRGRGPPCRPRVRGAFRSRGRGPGGSPSCAGARGSARAWPGAACPGRGHTSTWKGTS